MYTSPSFPYKSMLRMSKVSLELITDTHMLLSVQSAVRGVLVQCCQRYARTNYSLLSNPSKDYKTSERGSYLQMLDWVNLYGYSQSQPLPWGNFRFIESVDEVDWSTHVVDTPTGYIMECDIVVPDSVHDQLSDLPPLPDQEIPLCKGDYTELLE